jgi:hypothetical protein
MHQDFSAPGSPGKQRCRSSALELECQTSGGGRSQYLFLPKQSVLDHLARNVANQLDAGFLEDQTRPTTASV